MHVKCQNIITVNPPYLRWGGGGLNSFRKDDGMSSPQRTTKLSGKAQVQEGFRSCTEDQNQIQTSSWYETILDPSTRSFTVMTD